LIPQIDKVSKAIGFPFLEPLNSPRAPQAGPKSALADHRSKHSGRSSVGGSVEHASLSAEKMSIPKKGGGDISPPPRLTSN